MQSFKVKCDLRMKPKGIAFFADDVEESIDYLSEKKPTHPLILSEALCEICI